MGRDRSIPLLFCLLYFRWPSLNCQLAAGNEGSGGSEVGGRTEGRGVGDGKRGWLESGQRDSLEIWGKGEEGQGLDRRSAGEKGRHGDSCSDTAKSCSSPGRRRSSSTENAHHERLLYTRGNRIRTHPSHPPYKPHSSSKTSKHSPSPDQVSVLVPRVH